jgi:hypothetical protein
MIVDQTDQQLVGFIFKILGGDKGYREDAVIVPSRTNSFQ